MLELTLDRGEIDFTPVECSALSGAVEDCG
jgi:hypothetical protein